MTVIRGAEAPRFHLPGVEFTGLASPSRGSSDICTWRLTVQPTSDEPEPHTVDRDEIFMVISGSVRITGEDLGPGDVAIVPAGAPIQLVNAGHTPAELYVAIRAGFTGTLADGTNISPPWAR